jgi:5-methyltetrahydrofolate--homocysteine methyltransferase
VRPDERFSGVTGTNRADQFENGFGGGNMLSTLERDGIQVEISPDGPITMIGEKINPTGHKKLSEALKTRSFAYIRELAEQQIEAGAHVLDVNASIPDADETRLLPEVVKVVAEHVGAPLCIDSNNVDALAAALKVCPGKPLINSVNGEKETLERVLPLVRDRGAAVIGLTMDDSGIPTGADKRLQIAELILNRAVKAGIPAEDVLIDPLVLTVGADQQAGVTTLAAIKLIRERLGVNINLGASNVSFGLPERQTINQAFLALSFSAGATCVITDPGKLAGTVLACDLLFGRDPYGKRFLKHVRSSMRAK